MIALVELFLISVGLFVFANILARLLNRRFLNFAVTIFFLVLIFSFLILIIENNLFGVYLGFIKISAFSAFFALIITFGMILIQINGLREQIYNDFSLLSTFSFLGMLLAITANTVISLFIGLELLSIPIVLSLFLSKKWMEAGIKYFIVTAFSASLFAFGAATLFFSTGNLSLNIQAYNVGNIIALLFFIAGIGIEAGIFPFNLWMPDVYQGSPSFITAMLGGLNEKIGVLMLIYITFLLLPFSQNLLLLFSVLTMFYGNLAALVQRNVKRLMAYSSISQVGYILIGLAMMNRFGLSASIFQIFAHLFAFIGVFSVISMLESKNRTEINDYIGLYSENRLMGLTITVLFLSMIGVPFTAGFIGKFLLFSSAVSSNFSWLAIIGIINTVISVYYYARVIIAVYTKKENARYMKLGKSLSVVAIASLSIILFFGIYPTMIIALSQAAANAL